LTNNGADDVSPVWSPDGKQTAFVSYLYDEGEIYIMEADGSRQRRLTNNEVEDSAPDW
jgi:TolB protein